MTNIVLLTDKLTKNYGSLAAVKDLTLQVLEGEVFGLLGPNSAGKTTTINMMCGLLKPDSGTVSIHGKRMNGGDTSTRTRVGVCPQEIVLWERLTCMEQLQFIGQMYGLRAQKARRNAEILLEELDLVEKRNKQARTLSGGMQRRLNLAMALVHDPEIVVLDEPEAGLDPQSRLKVRQYIQNIAHEKTVILTTHNMDEAERLADRVAIIDHGQLLVLDTPDALKRRLGEGDVIEINLANASEETTINKIKTALEPIVGKALVEISENTLSVHALDAVSTLPAILETLKTQAIQPGGIHIRQNTLEDVFIQLTGRRLRE